MLEIKLYRVKTNFSGAVPKGFTEGVLVGFTKKEFDSVSAVWKSSFEEVTLETKHQSEPIIQTVPNIPIEALVVPGEGSAAGGGSEDIPVSAV